MVFCQHFPEQVAHLLVVIDDQICERLSLFSLMLRIVAATNEEEYRRNSDYQAQLGLKKLPVSPKGVSVFVLRKE
jgi:hypothetical protein